MKISYLFLIAAVTAVLGLGSCTTDFELNAPYEAVPVVYGFVEPTLDTQYVKISKSYLGDGNNYSYAAINDSVSFAKLDGTVEATRNGTVVGTFPLEEKYVSNLDQGIFYTDSQKIYFWVPDTIYTDATYAINISINEGQKEVTAETEVVGFCDFKSTFKSKLVAGAAFANTSAPGASVYGDFVVEWSEGINGMRYQVLMFFSYDEYDLNNVPTRKVISTTMGTQVQGNSSSFSLVYNTESFYAFVQSRLKNNPNEALVLKRVPRNLEFHIVMADENLHTYMEVNEPASGIVTERPVFTNINGGIGLFASRNVTVHKQVNSTTLIKLSLNSEKELVWGDYTNSFKFCSENYTDPAITCQ